MSNLLPHVASISDYRRVYGDSQIWSLAIHEIAEPHGLPGAGVRQTLGSHVVYRFGDSIVKLYFPMWFGDYRVERIALLAIFGLPAPRILADGDIEGWPYLVMSHVPGVPAVEVWRTLSAQDRIGIALQIGETMRLLHAPLAHYAYGEPEVSKALLRGYGLDVTGPAMESLTRYCLLHEFGRLGDFLDRHFAADPEAFVEALWGAGRS